MDRKSLAIVEMDEAGKGLAKLGSLSGIDHDGDTYAPGAFMWKSSEGQWCSILPCHDWRAMPFGKARVYEAGDDILAEINLNLDCQAGRDWHAALRFDLEKGVAVQEWSYGFNSLDADFHVRGDSRVRVLKRQDVMEVSPVLRGAGLGSGTLALKNAALKEGRFTGLIEELGGMAQVLKSGPDAISASGVRQLAEIHDAIGAALKGLQADGQDGTGKEIEVGALAGFLKHQARRHLMAKQG